MFKKFVLNSKNEIIHSLPSSIKIKLTNFDYFKLKKSNMFCAKVSNRLKYKYLCNTNLNTQGILCKKCSTKWH